MMPILKQAEQFAYRVAGPPAYRNDRVNPEGMESQGRPDVVAPLREPEQPELPAPGMHFYDRDPMPLYRGVSIPVDSLPEHLQSQLMGGGGLYDLPAGELHGQFGSDLLDHLQSRNFQSYPTVGYGGGTHWSTSKSIATSFAYNPKPTSWQKINQTKFVPVVMRAQWDGRGEDPTRDDGAQGFPEESEITMLPGTQLHVDQMHLIHPDTGAHHDITPEGGKHVYA